VNSAHSSVGGAELRDAQKSEFDAVRRQVEEPPPEPPSELSAPLFVLCWLTRLIGGKRR
jgi:hypothetical protein